ncbi:hypothetical protein GPJ56_003324 [Histomonas meleagridis]|uniref:uncharacterized protein n=1 Tax=Histomonas meleagridis TaxID=135588 RepID=UPI0035594B64|nr:hypothetical protein GPJ56_003324 [Histomonas meleagridis]KAH0804943.1 hypothetical protein GO595_001888 [Histomonas meleagridis]
MSLPSQFWNALSRDDQEEFIRLRTSFHNGQKISSKDRRIVTFSKELNIVLRFLERSEQNQEARCILTGICFVGPIICVNNRQLKAFLSRCKSSINGSFQQLGYVALKTKSKARNCVISALPMLQSHPNILKQWTVRCASDKTKFCFVSSFTNVQMPEILDEDLYDEKQNNHQKMQAKQFPATAHQYQYNYLNQIQPIRQTFMARQPLQIQQLDDDLPTIDDLSPETGFGDISTMPSSISVDNFSEYDTLWSDFQNQSEDPFQRASTGLARSESAFIQISQWDPFSDNPF